MTGGMPAVGSGCRRCGRSGIRNCWTSIAATCLPRYALPFDIGHGIGGLKLMAVCVWHAVVLDAPSCLLFPLDKSLFFIHKPATYVKFAVRLAHR